MIEQRFKQDIEALLTHGKRAVVCDTHGDGAYLMKEVAETVAKAFNLKSATKPFNVLPSVYTSSHLCDAPGCKRVELAVKQHVRSSDAAFRSIARIAKKTL